MGTNSTIESKEADVVYNKKTTGDQALGNVDLTNKVAIITGCNSGIGKETVRVMAKQNCTIIMACRNLKKAETAKQEIISILKDTKHAQTLDERLIIMHLDLADLTNIKQFVKDFNEMKLDLHYLINNAGVFGYKSYTLSPQGYELQFAINHLGHFHLTKLLLPNLLDMTNKKEPSRVIHVASAMHKDSVNLFGPWIEKHIEMECGPLEKDYDRSRAYSNAKACVILFARELQRRYEGKFISVAVHPGFVATDIAKNLANGLGDFVMKNIMSPWLKDCNQGSATTLRCVGMKYDELKGGCYYVDCKEADGVISKHLQQIKYDKIEDSMEYKCWKWSEILIEKAEFGENDKNEQKEDE